jgi:hypothetical protein
VVLQRGDGFRGHNYAKERKIFPFPLKEGFSGKDFLLKHVKVREFYMVFVLFK